MARSVKVPAGTNPKPAQKKLLEELAAAGDADHGSQDKPEESSSRQNQQNRGKRGKKKSPQPSQNSPPAQGTRASKKTPPAQSKRVTHEDDETEETPAPKKVPPQLEADKELVPTKPNDTPLDDDDDIIPLDQEDGTSGNENTANEEQILAHMHTPVRPKYSDLVAQLNESTNFEEFNTGTSQEKRQKACKFFFPFSVFYLFSH